jgi:uncharacterized protein with FMN-binding domain
MAQKSSPKLVAVATAAVTAIYMTGYLATSGVAAAAPVVPTSQPAAVATVAASSTTAQVVTSAAASAATTTTSAYKDGTNSGTGNSRRGGFDVAVTIAGGRITNVAITRAFTEYPASRVAALPAQVVARQSASVDKVTGATYSAQAFQQAVQAALAKATP